ncbi:MAG: hypothetical protein HY319_02990 [Armatimonadetes bacterium]|nr:hypothetical protein [Armatimonadota bacterium]
MAAEDWGRPAVAEAVILSQPSGTRPPVVGWLAALTIILSWVGPWMLTVLADGLPGLALLCLTLALPLSALAARVKTLTELLLIGAIGAILISILAPKPRICHCPGQLTACKSNLKNLGTALEMYSIDNGGLYPTTLDRLAPEYLKTVPTCPTAGMDTYSGSFRSAAGPDLYTIMCAGQNHTRSGVEGDYPQYNTSSQGLIERP